MMRLLSALLALLALALPAAAQAWGFAGSDHPVDPAVRFGVLPNGMRYALRNNTTPRGAVMVRMLFDVGSLAEAEDQRGLAHFLEHMAFNGSRNVPEGEMVRLLERNGLAFGADTNASTGVDQISYRLDLPRNTPELIDLSLMLMREIASELTLDPAAVDRERGVIAAEQLARSGFQLDNAIADLNRAEELIRDQPDVPEYDATGHETGTYQHWIWYHIGLYYFLNQAYIQAA
ncbi:MAG: insulinase family protein, partial [Akkermansiaceae bacterium]|nr:insulinase family protein [Akkermansiaceae bacterium]